MNNHWDDQTSFRFPRVDLASWLIACAGRCRLPGKRRKFPRVFSPAWLLLAGIGSWTSVARAGFTLEMDVVRYHQYGYYFFPNLATNALTPNGPFGDYYLASYGYPTNGSWAAYHYDTNGLSWSGSGNWGYGDFDGMMHELTNGTWSIAITNATMTNVYRFAVTANFSSNDLPYVAITFPPNGAAGITNQPTFAWSGPTNYSDLVVYAGAAGAMLPVTETNWTGPVLNDGLNNFTPHYDSNSASTVISSVPVDAGSNPLAGWLSTAHLQDYSTSQFTVGVPDTSGTAHTLVAHYPFDATSGAVLDATVDTSGNGYNMSFGGGYGADGGVDLTADAAAGVGALQFHDGDGNSAGFLGWSEPAPPALLAALAGSFSVSGWIKTTQSNFGYDQGPADQGAGIVAADVGTLTNDVIPLALTGNKIGFNTGGPADVTLNSTASVNDGNYHQVVVTRNQITGQKIIYVDGVLDNFSSGSTNLLNAPQKLTIGALANAGNPDPDDGSYYNGYDGKLDDLQIYTGVLSATEVAELYAAPGSIIANGGGVIDFNSALGTTGLIWSTSGDSQWFVETTNTYNGSPAAAQSGSVVNSQSSTLSATVTGPGTLTFYWASQDDCSAFDYEFDIDGGYQADISCGPPWSQAGPYLIPAGQHTLSWTTYAYGDTDPTEAGFLDGVTFSQGSTPVITVNPFDQTNYPGYDAALYAAATGDPAPTWQWFNAGSGSPVPGATNALFIPTNSGTAGVAGGYYAVASNLAGSAVTATAAVTFVSGVLPPEWSLAFTSPLENNTTDATTNFNVACLLDGAGNMYSAGFITGTNTFGSNFLVSVNGQSAASILKQTVTGAAIWGLCLTNDGRHSSYAECMALAPGNGCYVAGNFWGTNWLGTNQLTDLGAGSTFLARLDPGGNVLWVRTLTGTNGNFTEYHELASDAAGNVTLSALISGTTSLGATNVTVEGQQGLLVQYDANGNVRWLQVPSGWPTYLVSQGGRLYGSMGGNAVNYIGGMTNLSDRKCVLFCLDAASGQAAWLQALGGALGQGNPAGLVDDDALVAVSGTNVFVAGSAWGSNAVFGVLSVSFPAAKGQYFARYDTNGNAQLATAFGSQFTWPWAIAADGAGNVYVGGDFDTYSFFGNGIIAAPFYATVEYIGSVDQRIPGQGFLARFDRNGRPLWARVAESESSYLNCRDVALAPDGIWACGFFNQVAAFGTIDIAGGLTVSGSPIGIRVWHPAAYLAKIVQAAPAQPLTLMSPHAVGGSLQFSFLSQSSFTHQVQYCTNLIAGAGWQTYSNVPGDGTLKTIPVPLSLFRPSAQGFVRVATQ